MKIFLVNLDKDFHRLSHMDEQLRRFGLDYERFPAVLGRELTAERKRALVNRFRWWCTMCMPVTDGEIGCALSHYGIYERMERENNQIACVLEDDIVLGERFAEVLKYVEKVADVNRPQLYLLSNYTNERAEALCVKRFKKDLYAEAYVVTLPAAKALRKVNLPLQSPCDHWGRWIRRGVIEGYHAFPTVSRQLRESFGSNTNVGKAVPTTIPRYQKVIHKGLHALGYAMDFVLPL